MKTTLASTDRFLRIIEVCRITGRGKTSIWNDIRAGKFPSGVKIGPNSTRWLESEVVRWMSDRIEESRQG